MTTIALDQIVCPLCHAGIGEGCVSRVSGNPTEPHTARIRAVEKLERQTTTEETTTMITAELRTHTADQGFGHILDLAPVEFDTELADYWQELYKAQASKEALWKTVEFHIAQHERVHRGAGWGYKVRQSDIDQTLTLVNDWQEGDEITPSTQQRQAFQYYLKALTVQEEIDERQLIIALYNDVYRARGSWNRVYLVTNGNGHVHRSMECSTCRPTTQYYWVTELSAHTEAEIVEAAGERACTVCYPTAPVGVKGTSIFTPDEKEKQARAAEREAKRAAAKAAEVVVPDYVEETLRSHRTVTKTFKSERAASNAALEDAKSLCWYGTTHPSATLWLARVQAIADVLWNGSTDEVYEKARKSVKREGGEEKF